MRYLVLLVLLLVGCSRDPIPVTADAGPPPVIVVIQAAPKPAQPVEEPEDPDAWVHGGTGRSGLPPAISSGPESDCTGVMLTQFSGPGEPLRRGMAAMGSVIGTGGDFDPMIYFHTTDGAKRCAKGGDMDVATWTGRKWKVNK